MSWFIALYIYSIILPLQAELTPSFTLYCENPLPVLNSCLFNANLMLFENILDSGRVNGFLVHLPSGSLPWMGQSC